MATSTDLPNDLGSGYAGPAQHRPLGGYAVLSGIFGAAFTGALAVAARRGLPERISPADIVLAGIATHKLSRLIAKDKVTAFVRAPFTRFQDTAGHGEVEEEARGTGLRYATGELLICPYCLAQWVAGGFVAGYLHAPRVTRVLAATWTIHALADGVQLAYSAAESKQ
jgi:hypothetical protein